MAATRSAGATLRFMSTGANVRGCRTMRGRANQPVFTTTRYPEYLMPVAGDPVNRPKDESMAERYERFSTVREALLVGYCYNTARAYWGDLDDLFRWAEQRAKDVLSLSEKDLKQYFALLKRRKYSESTVRRRRTAVNKLLAEHLANGP